MSNLYLKVAIKKIGDQAIEFSPDNFQQLRVNDGLADHYQIGNVNILMNKVMFRQVIEKLHGVFVASAIKKPVIIFAGISNMELRRFVELNPHTSFLFNSSIWIRLINDAMETAELQKLYNETIAGIEPFRQLYKNGNAIEYFEYHLRLQNENYLLDHVGGVVTGAQSDSNAGHLGIAPALYSNETSLRAEIEIAGDLDFFFKRRLDDNGLPGMQFRILLIDDKIGNGESCKAELIKNLLELRSEHGANAHGLAKGVCWLTPTTGRTGSVQNRTYDHPIIDITTVIEDILNLSEASIQLIAVKTLDNARLLLQQQALRFDLILMDYLLDYKRLQNGNTADEREYATEFWGDGLEKYFELPKDPDPKNSAEKTARYRQLKSTYDQIKANRGPLQRLWIFPITAFNQTFIDDLRNKGVRLIDYYWYLNRGADPINTPYLFLYTLNKFLQLQIENAIFSKEELLGFLKKSLDRLPLTNASDDFIAFMGAEYTVFVERYVTRPVIYRDKQAGSLFARCIWSNFYNQPAYFNLFHLTNQIQKFYHRCAFGTSADYDKMTLFWRELKILVHEHFSDDLNPASLDRFRDKINALK